MIRSLLAPQARRTLLFKPKPGRPIFLCTWKGCGSIFASYLEVSAHIRETHIGPRGFDEGSDEEDFFFTEIEDEADGLLISLHPPSPPTLSHRDMARPPHEDPEYQRQLVGNYRQGLLSMSTQQQQQQLQQQQQSHHVQHHQQMNAAIKPPLPAATSHHQQQPLHHHQQSLNNNNAGLGQGSNSNGSTGSSNSNGSGVVHPHTSPLLHHSYSWSQVSPTSPQKHVRLSPRPSSSYPYPSPNYSNQIAQQQHYQQQQQQQQHLSQIQLSPGGATNYPSALGGGPITPGGGQIQPVNGTYIAPGASPSTASNRSPLSPNRRTRGENKKCRKVYGMDHKEQWCTQCKWKKACSRFGD